MRISPQAEEFKKCLPEEFQNVAEISFSYQLSWRIVSGHLKTLYDKYADPEYCLNAYYNGPEYRKNKHIIRRCPDIPLINIDDIQKMLDEERQYTQSAEKLLAILQEKDSDEKIHRLATLLGLYPNADPHALYRHLIAKDQIPANDVPQIIERITANKNLLGVITNILAKTFVPGYLLEFPGAGTVMTQQRGRYYYRGENAYYRCSKASRYRSMDATKPVSIQEFINVLRRYQCWETLDRFDAVLHWGFNEPNYLALAQHYGFRTEMLDITSNLKTALFFACCKFGEDRKWHPLSNEDFAHRNSRPQISGRGGDSRYGVLYRSPSEITDLRWCVEPDDSAFEIIIPVGYQPFMRCSRQYGYMLLTRPDYDLFQDKRFDKFKFRLTEDICQWIYEEMNRGDAIYPNNDIPDISPEIERLNEQTAISQKVFDNAATAFQLKDEDMKNVKTVLQRYGFSIRDTVDVIQPEKVDRINREYSVQTAMQKMGIIPQMSPIITLSANTLVDDDGQIQTTSVQSISADSNCTPLCGH